MKKILRTLVLTLSFIVMAFIPAACSNGQQLNKNSVNNSVFTVEFDSNGGSEIKSQQIKYGECVVEPDAPISLDDNHVFLGWYLQNEKYDFNTPVYGYLKLEAWWDYVKYTVTFDPCGGAVDETTQVLYKGNKAIEPIPDYEGYGFLGWYDEEDQLFDFETIVTKNTALHAKWAENHLIYEYSDFGSPYCWVTGYDGNTDEIVVPRYYAGCKVGEIDNKAFQNTNIKSLTIHGNVTRIGSNAFDGCEKLATVSLAKSVKFIQSYAFQGCVNLNSIIMPDGVREISYYAFNNCSNLRSIVISKSVTKIESNAFYGCANLELIKIDHANEFYTSSDFDGNEVNAIIEKSNNTLMLGCKNTIIPEGVVKINSGSFRVPSLKSIWIPSTVEYISPTAFKNYDFISIIESIKIDPFNKIYTSQDDQGNEINAIIVIANNNLILGCKNTIIPDNVETIDGDAFAYSDIVSIEIPEGVKSIGYGAFYSCTALASVTLPAGLEVIRATAFASCTNLPVIYLPNSLTFIGSEAFKNCSATIFCDFTEEEKDNFDSSWAYNRLSSVIYKGYLMDDNGFVYKLYDSDSYSIIGYVGTETEITLPTTYNGKNIRVIGPFAFGGRNNLKSVCIESGMQHILNYAFANCPNLESVTINANILRTCFGSHVFENDNSNLVIYSKYRPATGDWGDDWNCGYEVVYI